MQLSAFARLQTIAHLMNRVSLGRVPEADVQLHLSKDTAERQAVPILPPHMLLASLPLESMHHLPTGWIP